MLPPEMVSPPRVTAPPVLRLYGRVPPPSMTQLMFALRLPVAAIERSSATQKIAAAAEAIAPVVLMLTP